MRIKKWDYIHDRYYMVEIPKTGPEPEDWGASRSIPPAVEERYPDFEQQIKLRGQRLYDRKIARMKQLGLL